ncbi:SNF2 family N-terminal domain-containing protein [Scleroderma citrinum]
MDTEEELNFLLSGWAEPPVDVDRNTHGSGEDQYIAPSKNPDDINKFLIAAGNSEQFDGNASVTKALEKLKLPSLYSMLPGMAVSLLPHQTIGVAWALDREKGSDKGGCLGDEMGLGKTVQTIALMVINASNNSMCKTNLIVAPMALLDQWKLEIETKTNNLKCLIYHGKQAHMHHGPSKPKQKTELMKYDVVLTTYHTLALEWPDLEAEEVARRKIRKRKRSDLFVVSDPEDDRRAKRKKRELGLLFQIRWYRIIIDEAQNIRNRRTRISRSVTDLEATYRWCLTGTPIVNGLVDAYPLFRFIRLRPWYDWDDFNSHISRIEKKNPSLASTRLQAIFKMILLRRKKDSLLDGKRLIELPLKTVTLKKLAFSQEEREIYQMVEARSQAKFNRFLRTGTVLKNYHQVLVMLLRLRQICVHPVLIQETCDALVASNELNGGRDLKAERARATRLVSAEFVSKLTRQYKEAAMARILAERESADAIADADECPVCMDSPTDAIVTACGHTFCRECIVNVLNGPCVVDEENPQKYKGNERACPSCRSAISGDRIFIREAFEPQDHDLVEAGPSHCKADTYSGVETLHMSENILRDSKGKGKAKKRLHRRRSICNSDCEGYDDNLSDFIVEDDEDEDSRRELKPLKRKRMIVESDDDIEEDERETIFGHKESYVPTNEVKMLSRFLPSTKMKKMMEHLREWAEEHPDEKTIVISQWTEALKLVSNYLVENSIGHVKYQGSMNREQRDKAVRVFMLSDKAPVMLMSLKCGGVGLNLTRANRVISLDLGWSEAIENQAFDRVHRLGQQRNVFVQRLVIENTVEDRILALQERKRNLADGSLGEGNGKKIGRLNVRELANRKSVAAALPVVVLTIERDHRQCSD